MSPLQEKYTCKEIYSTHVDCSPVFNTSEYDSCSCSVHDEFYTCEHMSGAHKNVSTSTVTDMACACPTYIKGLIKDGNINAWDNKGCDGSDDCTHSKPYYITPMFWDKYATMEEDMASATATLIISLIGLCTCMACLVKVLSYITQNSNQAMLKKAARMDPYFAILVGTCVTLFVQSSSITTSVLTPLAASDVITLALTLALALALTLILEPRG